MGEKNDKLFFVALFFGALIIAILSFNTGIALNTNGEGVSQFFSGTTAAESKLVTVSGNVEKMVNPDQVEISLGVSTLNADVQESQRLNAELTSSVMAALIEAGIKEDEIQTISYRVYEEKQWDYKEEKEETSGYRATNNIKITLEDISSAGSVVDIAVKAGANNVNSIIFSLSEEKQKQIKLDALKEASSMAKLKAENVSAGLGVTLGEIHSITEQSFYYSPNYASVESARDFDGVSSAVTPVSPGDVSVSASVSLQYEIK